MSEVNQVQVALGLQSRLNDQVDEISHLLQSFSEALEGNRKHAENVFHGRLRDNSDLLVATWRVLSTRVEDSLVAMGQMKERLTALIVTPEEAVEEVG